MTPKQVEINYIGFLKLGPKGVQSLICSIAECNKDAKWVNYAVPIEWIQLDHPPTSISTRAQRPLFLCEKHFKQLMEEKEKEDTNERGRDENTQV